MTVILRVNTQKKLKETEYDNFLLREVIYEKTMSLNFLAYVPYTVVNQTNYDFFLYQNNVSSCF